MRTSLTGLVAVALTGLALLVVWPTFHDPVRWTPDGLYYQARLLQIRGASHDAAMKQVFAGPLSAELRARDPNHTGNAAWVAYNEHFYERRVSVPLVGAAVYPLAGNRTLLDLSLAGYMAAVLALFGLLLLRFRLAIAAGVTIATIFLPPLVHHSSYPLTDSWGLALEVAALAAAILTLDRGLRWLPLWVGTIALLAFTRDNSWIAVLAAGWCAVRYRSRPAVALLATGVAAMLPALLLHQVPARELLAMDVNNLEPATDTSWSFILGHYPHALLEYLRADGGFLRRGDWYTALYFAVGAIGFALLAWRRRLSGASSGLMSAAAVLAVLCILGVPVFSAFRVELVFVPIAAFGLAYAAELATARVGDRYGALVRPAVRIPARARRS